MHSLLIFPKCHSFFFLSILTSESPPECGLFFFPDEGPSSLFAPLAPADGSFLLDVKGEDGLGLVPSLATLIIRAPRRDVDFSPPPKVNSRELPLCSFPLFLRGDCKSLEFEYLHAAFSDDSRNRRCFRPPFLDFLLDRSHLINK